MLDRTKRESVAPRLGPHRGGLCPQAGKLRVETNTLFEKDSVFSASCFDNFVTQPEQAHVLSKTKTFLFFIRDSNNTEANE